MDSVYLILLFLLFSIGLVLRVATIYMKGKQRKNADVVISAIATLLVDDAPDDDLPLKEILDRKKLDYSFESLKVIDAYLDKVRDEKGTLNDEQIAHVIMRCGVYCGEVIRRNFKSSRHWISYDEYIERNPDMKDVIPQSFGSAAILFAEPDEYSFPLGKVMKYLENGSGESLYFFAQMIGSEKR